MENKDKIIHIKDISGIYTPTQDEIQEMYNYLKMYFYRSKTNGLVEIDTHERDEIGKLLKKQKNNIN